LRKNEKEKTDKRVGEIKTEKIDKSLLGHTIVTIESNTSDSDTSDSDTSDSDTSDSDIRDQKRKTESNIIIRNSSGVDSKNQEERVSIIKEHNNAKKDESTKKMKESRKKIIAKKVKKIKKVKKVEKIKKEDSLDLGESDNVLNKKRKNKANTDESPTKKSAITKNPDSDKQIFVKGLSNDATEDRVREYFAQCGEMTDCRAKSESRWTM